MSENRGTPSATPEPFAVLTLPLYHEILQALRELQAIIQDGATAGYVSDQTRDLLRRLEP